MSEEFFDMEEFTTYVDSDICEKGFRLHAPIYVVDTEADMDQRKAAIGINSGIPSYGRFEDYSENKEDYPHVAVFEMSEYGDEGLVVCLLPTAEQMIAWLKTKGVFVCVDPVFDVSEELDYYISIVRCNGKRYILPDTTPEYGAAALAGIRTGLGFLEDKLKKERDELGQHVNHLTKMLN